MTLFSNLCFSYLFVNVVHDKVNDLRCEQLCWQLIVAIGISVEIEVRFEDMLCFILKFLEGTGQMITVRFDNKEYILMISHDIRYLTGTNNDYSFIEVFTNRERHFNQLKIICSIQYKEYEPYI